MKYSQNIAEIALLPIHYMGFIFYKQSPRYVPLQTPKLPNNIKKVGVFVNEPISVVLQKIKSHQLAMVQLHGTESADYCNRIKDINPNTPIIKAFSVDAEFNWEATKNYHPVADYFLFDTKGENYGGNGLTFDWDKLKEYQDNTPYFLSGGIGLEQIDELNKFMQQPYAKLCHALDINSKVEDKPALKNTTKIKQLIQQLELLKNNNNGKL